MSSGLAHRARAAPSRVHRAPPLTTPSLPHSSRGRRDFGASDAIRNELDALGIKVMDSSRSWMASDGRKGNTQGPDFFSLHGTPWAQPGGGMHGGAGGAPSWNPAGGSGGPVYPPTGGFLPTDQIMARLAQREQVRTSKNYRLSDQMRDELREAGVHIEDRLRTWTHTDGRTGALPRAADAIPPPAQGGGMGAYGQPYGNAPPPSAPPPQNAPPPYGYGAPPPAQGGYGGAGGYGQSYGQPPPQYEYGQPPPQYGQPPPYGQPQGPPGGYGGYGQH